MSGAGPAEDVRRDSAPAFGLYVHWPFCKSKCPYCDFNSHVRAKVDQMRWRKALQRELSTLAAGMEGRRLDSIFFGGGTPSLMPPETAAAVIETARELWTLAADIEITLEANPTSVEAAAFAGFCAAGVNRVSLGVQALNDLDLAALGRQHSAAEALDALAVAKEHFRRFSFDLIYARPGQSAAAWEAELARALALGGDHLSLYQLTVEPNTVFHAAHRRGELALPPEEMQEALYELTLAMTAKAGLSAYEVSNHARPGQESRHNLIYWQGGDYLGIGPGAHGRMTQDGQRWATSQHRAPEIWLERVETDGAATRSRECLERAAWRDELILMGLRLSEGIERRLFAERFGEDPLAVISAVRLTQLTEAGLLALDETRLRATAAGMKRLNALVA